MIRAAVIDAPDLDGPADAGAYLASLGVQTTGLRVDLFHDPNRLRTRIRIVDRGGDVAPWLPTVDAHDGAVVVLRPDQLARIAAGRAGAS